MTKQQIIDALALLDTPTLERLLALGNAIILPDDEQLVKVTFEQMISKVHTLADTNFAEWTDRTKADLGEFLAELFCLFSEKDFWYINAHAEEGLLQKAKEYGAVWSHAKKLGYSPIAQTSATGTVRLKVQAGDEVVLLKGDIQLEINGIKFINDAYTITASATADNYNVPFIQGEIKSLTKNFNGRSITISDTGIVLSSIYQMIDSFQWDSVEYIADLDSLSKKFVLFPTSWGAEIIYGNGTYGMLPVAGTTINTYYIKNSGYSGNILLTDVAAVNITRNISRQIMTATPITNISGGLDLEDIDSIRRNAIVNLRTNGYLTSPDEVENYLLTKPNVLKAVAQTLFNDIYIRVILSGNNQPSQEDLDVIALDVQGKLPVYGYKSYGIQNTFVEITDVTLTAYFLEGIETEEGVQKIKDYILGICDPQNSLSAYGQGFILDDILDYLIAHISGLQNIVFNVLNGVAPVDITISATDILEGLTEENLTINIG